MFKNKRDLFGIISRERIKHRIRPSAVDNQLVSRFIDNSGLFTNHAQQLVQRNVQSNSNRSSLIERQVDLDSIGQLERRCRIRCQTRRQCRVIT